MFRWIKRTGRLKSQEQFHLSHWCRGVRWYLTSTSQTGYVAKSFGGIADGRREIGENKSYGFFGQSNQQTVQICPQQNGPSFETWSKLQPTRLHRKLHLLRVSPSDRTQPLQQPHRRICPRFLWRLSASSETRFVEQQNFNFWRLIILLEISPNP